MTNTQDILQNIENESNTIIAKLELLRMSEEEKESIKKELVTIKDKLEKDEISKFSYATMLEANKKKAAENTNSKKQTWDELAQSVNTITDKLNELKNTFNEKSDLEDGNIEITESKE